MVRVCLLPTANLSLPRYSDFWVRLFYVICDMVGGATIQVPGSISNSLRFNHICPRSLIRWLVLVVSIISSLIIGMWGHIFFVKLVITHSNIMTILDIYLAGEFGDFLYHYCCSLCHRCFYLCLLPLDSDLWFGWPSCCWSFFQYFVGFFCCCSEQNWLTDYEGQWCCLPPGVGQIYSHVSAA